MGIEELINKYKKEIHNYEKYIDGQWACEIDRISGMKIAVEVLKDTVKDLEQLKSSLPTPEITEQQALSKIAERFPVGTDQLVKMLESTEALSKQDKFCAPHSCRSQIWIDTLIEKIDKEMFAYPKMKPECGKDPNEEFKGGYNKASEVIIGYLEELPTQPELVEVPPCADVFLNNGNKELNLAYLISCKRNFLSCEMREGELKQWLRNTSLHDLLSLANGYTVKKEQLYYVKVGIMAFMDWNDSFVAKMCTTDSTGWENMAAQLSLDKAEGVALLIGGEAVPVDQEPKLPQEIEVSEYLEEEE